MIPRRSTGILVAAGAAVLLAVTACASSGSAGSSGETTPTTPSSSSAVTPSASGTASSSESVASSGSAGSSPTESAVSSATESAPATGGTTLPASCTPAEMKTHTAGVLTVSTDEPVYEPWFVDDKPENGKGFESAVAYAVAEKLGYAKDKVTWVRAHFDDVISPAPKDFDFDINEFSITPDRAKVVDFSSGYYDVAQAVVTTKDSKIAKATSIADLQGADLGAQIGTTSLDAITDQIKTSSKPSVFQTNDAAVKALQNGQIDGLVTDLPTAFYMTGAQLDNGVIVGQLPVNDTKPEQFGLLLEKDSSLTSCVSAAVDALRADGTLDALQKQWLAEAGAPELK